MQAFLSISVSVLTPDLDMPFWLGDFTNIILATSATVFSALFALASPVFTFLTLSGKLGSTLGSKVGCVLPKIVRDGLQNAKSTVAGNTQNQLISEAEEYYTQDTASAQDESEEADTESIVIAAGTTANLAGMSQYRSVGAVEYYAGDLKASMNNSTAVHAFASPSRRLVDFSAQDSFESSHMKTFNKQVTIVSDLVMTTVSTSASGDFKVPQDPPLESPVSLPGAQACGGNPYRSLEDVYARRSLVIRAQNFSPRSQSRRHNLSPSGSQILWLQVEPDDPALRDELCSVCEEYIAEWFCRKCGRKLCQVLPARTPRGANTSKRLAPARHFCMHPRALAALRARLPDASCAGASRSATGCSI